MKILVRVKIAEWGKRTKAGIFCRIGDNRETLILYLTVHCFYSLFAWFIAENLYFMEIKDSYANSRVGKKSKAREKDS